MCVAGDRISFIFVCSFENQIITAIKKIRNSNDNEILKRFLKPSQKNLLQTKT